MSAGRGIDLQRVVGTAARMQLAWLDYSLACWQTALDRGDALTELLSDTAASLAAGDARLEDSARRFADFGFRSLTEAGKLSIGLGTVMLSATIDPTRRVRRSTRD